MVEGGYFAHVTAKLSFRDKRRRAGKELADSQFRYKLDCTPFIAFLIYLLGLFLSFVYCHHVCNMQMSIDVNS